MKNNPVSDVASDTRIQEWIGSILAGTAGVHDVRVLVGGDDEVDGVLLRADSAEIAEAVRAKLAAGAAGPDGYRLDPEHLYVALPSSVSLPEGALARIALDGVDVMLSNERARVRVRLARGAQQGVGIESGGGGQIGILRLVCEATVAALRELGSSLEGTALESVTVADTAGPQGARRIVLTVFHVSVSGWDGELVGTAVIRRTDAEAAARATLDALNRHTG